MFHLPHCAAAASLVFLCLQGSTALASPSLFSRMGEAPVVRKVVQTTLETAASDPRTARSFKDVKLAAITDSLYSQICSLAGGGCVYEGETMKNAHADLGITRAEFELMVQMLRDALDAHGVKTAEKNELLKLLAPMHRDIVTGSSSKVAP